MEGLEFGWRKAVRKQLYHYVPNFSNRFNENVYSLCGQYQIDALYGKSVEFLKIEEILDQSQICHTCEIKLQRREDNKKKKQILTEITNEFSNHVEYLKETTCSEDGCFETGLVPITTSESFKEKPHYCLEHNPRVQKSIIKTKEIAA